MEHHSTTPGPVHRANAPLRGITYATTIHNEHILAVNMTITSYAGAYTCQVTANDRQEVVVFTLRVSGMFDTLHLCTHMYMYYAHAQPLVKDTMTMLMTAEASHG